MGRIRGRARVRSLLAYLILAAIGLGFAAPASAQFYVAFQKASDRDDDVEDVPSGFPPTRQCPTPCNTAHFVCRIINCPQATADGRCMGSPNPGPVTGGVFTDTPPALLPLDCARGVTVTGTGTWDPPTCDTGTNTVTVTNINIPPGEVVTISFWAAVDCTSGTIANQAFFDYDQNATPSGDPIAAYDPALPFGSPGLAFNIGDAMGPSSPTKDAPSLPLGMMRRFGGHGARVPWIIEGSNPSCEPLTFRRIRDVPTPEQCMTTDCSTLRLFINDVPRPLPPGSACPDPGPPRAEWLIGELTLQPQDRLRIEFDAIFTSDMSVSDCCNVAFFVVDGLPLISSSDPALDIPMNPEYTCTTLAIAPPEVQVDAIKAAEDAAGNRIADVGPGGEIYWRFTVTNQGDSDITFTLDDDFPAAAVLGPGAVVEPFPSGTCTITGQHLQCADVALPMRGTVEMRAVTTLDCTGLDGGDRICNEGTISSPDLTMPGPTHCPDCGGMPPANLTCVTFQGPNLSFASKSVTDESRNGLAAVGEVLRYTIEALNSGTADATSVIVRDQVPAGTSYVPGTLTLDGVTLTDMADADAGDVTGDLVRVVVGDLPPLTPGRGIVTFDVRLDTETGAQLCNADAVIDWNEATACGGTPLTVPPACIDYEPAMPQPDLSAVKSVSPAGMTMPGAVLHYTVGVCNGRTAAPATGVVLTDIIPPGTAYRPGTLQLEFVALTDAADADAGEFIGAPPASVRVAIGDLAAGECKRAEFDVTVDAGTTGTVSNVAQVLGDGVASFDSNTVDTPVDVIVEPPPQLSITKSSALPAGPPARRGSRLTYTVRACNDPAAGTARNVEITDAVPLDALTACGGAYLSGSITVDGVPQTDALDGDLARFEPLPAPGGVVVSLPALAPGACVELVFDVAVNAGCDDTEVVSNTAFVRADGVAALSSATTADAVTVDPEPPVPVLLRKEGFPIANRCPAFPTLCGCEVGPRLDPAVDDCLVAGTCTQLSPTLWSVPGDLLVHVPLVFYEVHGAGCVAAGDAESLTVRKGLPDDIVVELR